MTWLLCHYFFYCFFSQSQNLSGKVQACSGSSWLLWCWWCSFQPMCGRTGETCSTITECVLDLTYIYDWNTCVRLQKSNVPQLSNYFASWPVSGSYSVEYWWLVVTTLCFLNYIFSSGVKHFRNLVNARNVWELNKDERIKLAYVFQSSHREKASKEFLDVSQAYMQVNSRFAYCL